MAVKHADCNVAVFNCHAMFKVPLTYTETKFVQTFGRREKSLDLNPRSSTSLNL